MRVPSDLAISVIRFLERVKRPLLWASLEFGSLYSGRYNFNFSSSASTVAFVRRASLEKLKIERSGRLPLSGTCPFRLSQIDVSSLKDSIARITSFAVEEMDGLVLLARLQPSFTKPWCG